MEQINLAITLAGGDKVVRSEPVRAHVSGHRTVGVHRADKNSPWLLTHVLSGFHLCGPFDYLATARNVARGAHLIIKALGDAPTKDEMRTSQVGLALQHYLRTIYREVDRHASPTRPGVPTKGWYLDQARRAIATPLIHMKGLRA